MTLFNDEEDDEDKLPPSPLRRWLKRLVLFALFLLIFTWITLRALMSLGGDSAPLREGMEQLFLRTTGLHAAITKFNYMKFYPDVSVDMGGINLSEAKLNASVATIGGVKITANFWSVLYPSGEVRAFSIENLDLTEGYYFRKALHVDKLELEPQGGPGQTPAFVISGRYGDDPFNGYVAMEWHKDTPKKEYFSRPKKSAFSFKSSFASVEGELSNHPDGGILLTISGAGFPDNVLAGTFLIRGDGDVYTLQADLKGGNSRLMSDVTMSGGKGYAGTLRLPVFDTADWRILQALFDFNTLLWPDAEPGQTGKTKADLAISIDELRINHAKAGQLSFPVKSEGGVTNIGPIKGSISGGDASGQASLDGSKKNFSLVLKTLVRDMKYGELQKELFGKQSVAGKATFDVSLASEAATTADLVKNLKGEAALVAAEGDLSAGMLDLWGKGLIAIMLPKFGATESMKLNCLIADFKFADGLANADPLFLDSDIMTVIGEGSITLSGDPQINLLLAPKAKSTDLLGTAVGARIKGPLLDPDIGSDRVSPGKKAAGVPSEAHNSAFLGLSMADLGLNEQHPCHQFLGKAP